MKSRSSVSENVLGDGKVRSSPATLAHRPNASISIGEGSHLVGSNDWHRSGDLRSFVAGRFMHMLRAHDHARMKVLASHPSQAR